MSKRRRSKKPIKKKAVPPKRIHWRIDKKYHDLICIAVIAIILIAFYRENVFFGKTFLSPDAMASKAAKPFIEEAVEKGEYPLWNPYILGGMPSFASMQAALFVDPITNSYPLLFPLCLFLLLIYVIAPKSWNRDEMKTSFKYTVAFVLLVWNALVLLSTQVGGDMLRFFYKVIIEIHYN